MGRSGQVSGGGRGQLTGRWREDSGQVGGGGGGQWTARWRGGSGLQYSFKPIKKQIHSDDLTT